MKKTVTVDKAFSNQAFQEFDPHAYGARGDGVCNDTAAVQRALDACGKAGGGVVRFAPGIYPCGTLDLIDHTEIYLEAGAVLRGSPSRDDYRTQGNAVYDKDFPGRKTSAAHLIRAVGARNIAIRGRGVIDGNGTAFLDLLKPKGFLGRHAIRGWRPGHMIALCECRDVLIEDVQLLNAPTYTIWPFACERLRIHGVTIRTPPEIPNGDGIDPTACRDVIISDCFIETSDDCIALYSGPANGAFGTEARACENITITNCILRSRCGGVRIGAHGDGPIRHCVMSNLVIEARSGIALHAYRDLWGEQAAGTILENIHGARVYDIRAENISIRGTNTPLFIQIHPDSGPSAIISDISFRSLQMYSPGAVCITGCAERPVQRITLSDISLGLEPAVETLASDVPDPLGKLSELPCLKIAHAIYLRHVRDAQLRHIRFHRLDATDPRPVLTMQQSENAITEDICEWGSR